MEFFKKVNTGTEMKPQKNMVVYKIGLTDKICIRESSNTKVVYEDNSVAYLDIELIVGSGYGSSMPAPTTNIPNVQNAKTIVVGTQVTEIGHHAFWGLNDGYDSQLYAIKLHDKITSIRDFAFVSNKKLSVINLPQSITYIGEGAFVNNYSLGKIVIPEGVTELRGCFENCYKLETVILPSTISNIKGGNAMAARTFGYCTNLKTIKYNGTLEDFRKIQHDSATFEGANLNADLVCTDQTIKISDIWD